MEDCLGLALLLLLLLLLTLLLLLLLLLHSVSLHSFSSCSPSCSSTPCLFAPASSSLYHVRVTRAGRCQWKLKGTSHVIRALPAGGASPKAVTMNMNEHQRESPALGWAGLERRHDDVIVTIIETDSDVTAACRQHGTVLQLVAPAEPPPPPLRSNQRRGLDSPGPETQKDPRKRDPTGWPSAILE
ncbi:unnamed protein product [Arctogadus glacialis]